MSQIAGVNRPPSLFLTQGTNAVEVNMYSYIYCAQYVKIWAISTLHLVAPTPKFSITRNNPVLPPCCTLLSYINNYLENPGIDVSMTDPGWGPWGHPACPRFFGLTKKKLSSKFVWVKKFLGTYLERWTVHDKFEKKMKKLSLRIGSSRKKREV